jgi:hypothetical protein
LRISRSKEKTCHVYAHPWLDALWKVEFMSVSSSLGWSGGDYSQNYISEKFHSYWWTTIYLGLPAVGQNKSRTYTPYLIDTVTAYFEVCDGLWNHSLSITAENILKALNGSGPLETHPSFQGCTGLVAIDSTTGSQSINDQTTYL